MTSKDNRPEQAAELRCQAEAKLSERKKKAADLSATEVDARRLVHELEVHQIELEMQNEELMQSRAQVEAGLRQYTDLYEFAPVGYFTLAHDGAIRRVNLAGANLLGVERGALIKRRLGLFVSAQSRTTFSTFLEKVFGSRQKESCEVTLQKDGAWVHIEAITEEDAQRESCRAVVMDVTERKRVEDELKKIAQLKSDFVSTASHELRTPLSVIREAVSQVLDGVCGEINKEQNQFLSMSIGGIDRLSRLIENLLEISRIEAHKIELKKELIDIVSIAKETSASFAPAFQSKGLEIRHNFSKDKIELYGDKDRIIQIFVNLMSNALKFTPAGHMAISIVDKETVVECGVSDTGIGISDQDLSRVFGKFQQFGRVYESAEKGTGLGLAISKGIIELHRGKIWVESKYGQGTKISFTLPKYSPRELFREYVGDGLAEAIKTGASLSIIVYEVENHDTLQEKLGQDKIAFIMHGLGRLIKTDLRGKSDISIEDSRAILVVLPETDKKGAWSAAVRFKASIDDYLSKEGLAEEIEVDLGVASFPEDARTEEELLNKVQLVRGYSAMTGRRA